MAATDDLTDKLTALSRVLVFDDGLDSTLARVAELSTSLIDVCDGCGVSLVQDGTVSTRAASDARADRVDEIQYSEGEGPCLHAIETGAAVRVPSFDSETRWPSFIERAVDEGIISSYSVPLDVGGDVVGSLNFYSSSASFGDEERRIGDLLAAQAAVGLRNAEKFERARSMVDQLTEALDSRDTIGQAKGILMTRHDLDADQAFDTLRAASQHRNIKLRDLAAMVITGDVEIDATPDSR